MKKVYESLSFHKVGHYRSMLEEAGIECSIRNLGVGGVMGEVPFVETYPELWVSEDADVPRALALIEGHRREIAEAVELPDWTCPQCAQPVPGNFLSCWNCGADKPTATAS